MAREGNRVRAGADKKLKVVRYGREEMNQHERAVLSDVLPGEPVALTADAEGRAAFDTYSSGDVVYVVEEARGRGMDINTDDGYKVNPATGDGPDIAPAVKPSGGGLNVRVTNNSGASQTVEPGTAITPDGTDGFVVDGTEDIFALADDTVTIANGETEIVSVEVA